MNAKRRFLPLALALLCLLSAPSWAKSHRHNGAAGQHAPPEETLSLSGAEVTVAFSPNGDSTDVVVKAIRSARKEILVQAYSFTSAPIIKALGEARARGVDVKAILDKTNESPRYSGATYLTHHDIPVWIDDSVAIAHNKVMVIDGDTVITGSFNFTEAAQRRNAENVMVISHAPALARIYAHDWTWRKGLSHPYPRS
jgi:phosphatidylserine/phosphatidylglycerophosphate/cardiolipin synthase-like enzyme